MHAPHADFHQLPRALGLPTTCSYMTASSPGAACIAECTLPGLPSALQHGSLSPLLWCVLSTIFSLPLRCLCVGLVAGLTAHLSSGLPQKSQTARKRTREPLIMHSIEALPCVRLRSECPKRPNGPLHAAESQLHTLSIGHCRQRQAARRPDTGVAGRTAHAYRGHCRGLLGWTATPTGY